MDEKTQRAVDRMQDSLHALAESQATVAVGAAVLSLIEQGMAITPENLIQWLQDQAQQRNSALIRAQNEAAEKAIRAAQP